MNHHFIPNRHQLRRVCLFRCGTYCGCSLGTSVFTPVLFSQATLWHLQGLVQCVCVYVFCICACILVHCRLCIFFQARKFTFYLHTLTRVCLCPRAGTSTSAVMSLSVYSVSLLCLCQWLHVGKACYIKKWGCGALCRSQWIHLHSFHCLSLLRAHSNYQQLRSATTLRILSPSVKKWAAGGAFL